jgi:hypothetical protein
MNNEKVVTGATATSFCGSRNSVPVRLKNRGAVTPAGPLDSIIDPAPPPSTPVKKTADEP